MKKIIATLMTLALLLGLCSATAFAADDIVLDGDQGDSSFVKEFKASGGEYKYLGYVTTKNATSEYKYLQFTYTGDISTLRMEFNTAQDTNDGPYWFTEDQAVRFKTADGSKIVTNATSPTTVVIDLAASGIDIGKYVGIHLHYLSPDLKSSSFTVTDARLMTSATSAGTSSTGNSDTNTTTAPTAAANTGSSSVPTVVACAIVVVAGAVLVCSRKKRA